MKRKYVLTILLVFLFSGLIFAVDNTDDLLDNAIEEFSKKNYEEAIIIIDSVLVLEPENKTAIMYKQTIEDVINSDESVAKEQPIDTVIVPLSNSESVIPKISNDEVIVSKEKIRSPLYSSVGYIGQSNENLLMLENRFKINLGIPTVGFSLVSHSIEYNISDFTFDNVPLDGILNEDNYSFDFSIGARYLTFRELNRYTGFFDIKVGAVNFTNIDSMVVPYVGFDSEVAIFSPLLDNFILNNLWVGSLGSLYYFDGDVVDNYIIEAKLGFRVGILNLGWFYSTSKYNQVLKNNRSKYGLIVGIEY